MSYKLILSGGGDYRLVDVVYGGTLFQRDSIRCDTSLPCASTTGSANLLL